MYIAWIELIRYIFNCLMILQNFKDCLYYTVFICIYRFIIGNLFEGKNDASPLLPLKLKNIFMFFSIATKKKKQERKITPLVSPLIKRSTRIRRTRRSIFPE